MFPRNTIEWRLWLATVVLLTVGLFIDRSAIFGAILLTAFQAPLIAIARGSIGSFPAQVRFAYLVMLLLGLWSPFALLHWIQLIGTWAMVMTDYCFLARVLSLLPANRKGPLTWPLVQRVFFSKPITGNIHQGLPPAEPGIRQVAVPGL